LNAKAIAWWYRKRAAGEIADLAKPLEAAEHLSWVENGRRFFPAATDTAVLLERTNGINEQGCRGKAWPSELPSADAPSSER
jgi:hypothetical protein